MRRQPRKETRCIEGPGDVDVRTLPRREELYPSGDSDPKSRPDLVKQVVGCICSALETRRLHPGDRLPSERELSQHLDVSRSTVRSALGCLAAMGAIRIRRSVGNFVESGPPRVGAATLQAVEALHGFEPWQMFEARRILEGSLSALAAERGGDEDIVRLSEEISEMYATCDEPSEHLIHDLLFHRRVARASGNPILAGLMETVVGAIFENRQIRPVPSADLTATTRDHHEIYRAIRARDVRRARELMTQHLRRAEAQQHPLLHKHRSIANG